MRYMRAHNLTSLMVATLSLWMLLGTLAISGDDPALVPKSSSGESEERIDTDDVDDDDAIVGVGISVVDAISHYIQLEPHRDNPLHAHTWRWCSRGPPLA